MSLEHALFYKSIDGDRVYDDTSFEHWLKKFFTSGVFLNDFQVTSNGNMSVNVGTGYVNADGKVKIYQADTTLDIETAGATYPRIDSIVLERNDTERDIILKVVKGGYAIEPVAHVPVRQDGVYQLVIAQIRVNAGAVNIAQADITDTRSNMNLCGFVAGAVKQIDFSQIQAQFEEYLAYYEEYIADYATHMQENFEAWFENIKGQLSEDAAGHLQIQIDEMKEDLENVGGSRVEVAVGDNDGEYNVVGLTVKLEIDGQTYTKKVPSEKKVVFQVLEIGTATISCADGAQDYEATASIEIPCYSAYEATLGGGSGFKTWIEAGGYTKAQYPDVESVLADEKAVRKLMTVHASCDIFVEWYNKDNSMLAQFAANRVTMKWIGLRDYIADKLMSIPEALEQLLGSEYWEYILKDKIPTMTSNTAPEGVVSASSTFSGYNAYSAFDGKNSTGWLPTANAKGTSLYYRFNNPIVIKKISVFMQKMNSVTNVMLELRASNDGVHWDALTTFESGTTEKIVDNNKAYLYYGIYSADALAVEGVGSWEVRTLQFYGRSLNETVPIMTSNTAPLGVCSASSAYSANYYAFRAFEGLANSTTGWNPADTDKFGSAYVQYEFVKPVKVGIVGALYKDTSRTFTYKVLASNDGVDFEPIIESMEIKPSLTNFALYEANADKAYKYYRFVYMANSANAIGTGNGAKFQLYGVSYSEEEFGSDGIEMLYDNGVKFGNTAVFNDANGTATEEADYISCSHSSNANGNHGIQSSVSLDGYGYVVAVYSDKTASGARTIVQDADNTISNAINIDTNVTGTGETRSFGTIVANVVNVSGNKTMRFRTGDGVTFNKELLRIRKFYLIRG